MRCRLFVLIAAVLALTGCVSKNNCSKYSVKDGQILKNGVPYYYIGTNVWYAPALAVENPERLIKELDTLQALGLKNLRILATDENWEGLDFTLSELEKRDMAAVLYLNNAWEWTPDGYISYLEKAGMGHQPRPAVEGYTEYMNTMWKFASTPEAVALYHEHVRNVVTRYKDNPAIFSWQICNEPRPFTKDDNAINDFVKYIQSTAALIKSIDHNHLVSTGNEGTMGSNENMYLYSLTHNVPEIDYLTIHIWPYNWSWVTESTIDEGVETAIAKTKEYIDNHVTTGYQLNKPVVIEEFGYPRDGFDYRNTASVNGRNKYYNYVFSRVVESAEKGQRLAGCNFWTWSGYAHQNPEHQFHQEGDDYCGDPFQEAQGLNGVYLTDVSTIDVIKEHTGKLNTLITLFATDKNQWFQTGDGNFTFDVTACSQNPFQANVTADIVTDLSLMGAKDTILSYTLQFDGTKNIDTKTFDLGVLEPGFYQVNLSLNNNPVQQFNIGTNPEQIVSPQDKPEDFDAFWENTLKELAAVPMEVVYTERPDHSDSLRITYDVEIKSLGGASMGGILCVPVKPGKYPTYIDYMGYGAEPYYYYPSANPDNVEFLVSVRDQGIFKKDNNYWIDRNLDDKNEYYYRGAFADVVRAIDFIESLESVDTAKVFARGESQGGAFTWISASLDHRIKAIAPAVPFLSDYRHYGQIVWWPMWEVYGQCEKEGLDKEKVLDMLRYFDIKNFTDKIECPVYMAFGLQDPTCPPHTNFSGYNMVKSQKEYYCVPTCGHAMWQENSWQEKRAEFFDRFCQ